MTPAMVLLMQRLNNGEVVDILSSDGGTEIAFQLRFTNGDLQCRQFFRTYDHYGKWFSHHNTKLASLLHFSEFQAAPKQEAIDDTRQVEL